MPITWDQVRDRINAMAEERGEWAGFPMPIDRLRLTMESNYPFKGVDGFAFNVNKEQDDDAVKIRNYWHSEIDGNPIFIYEEDGKIKFCTDDIGDPGMRAKFAINTLGASAAWNYDAELKAVGKLRSLVKDHTFKQYMMTGTFLETSKRSGVIYMFRRLRPTLAMRATVDDNTTILAALCLHPIGHYEESFGGVMVPTDDIISHLLLMRADEHGFWKRANHHNLNWASSGL